MVFGYCRISTKSQSIERQIRNIKEIYPEAVVVEEVFTGTKIEGRENWNKLYKKLKEGDKIVFDSVSRMSRNEEEGFQLYQNLFEKGVELEFLKEPHINTEVYKDAISGGIELTGTDVDDILIGVNKYMLRLAKKQIKLAFEQAEKEVNDLKQRTREGLQTAKLNGKRIGTEKGRKLVTKKSLEAKEKIRKYSRDFNGTLTDKDVMTLIGIARNSYYKYKKEIIQELGDNQNAK